MKKLILLFFVLSVAALLMTGCLEVDKVTGGGWFTKCICGEEVKVTFGFNAQDKGDGIYSGQFQLVEHRKDGLDFHVNDMWGLWDNNINAVTFNGATKEDVPVCVTVWDEGEPGPDAGDMIAILYGLFPYYYGNIDGGNIQFH